ncbi:AraC-like DNA-binding protein [Oxalobacteraceae bacterium GrIS 1.11]
MSTFLAAAPVTRLIAPRLSLVSCVRAYMTRDTTLCPPLAAHQRLNRFPASPLCSLTWSIQGEIEMAAPGLDAADIKVAPVFFAGPQSRPTVSYHPGPAQLFMVMFYPSVWHKLCGIDVSGLLDQFGPVDALGPRWSALSQAVLAAPDDEARVLLIEQFLEPLWRAARAGDEPRGMPVGDWVRRLGVQAAAAGWGRGARNIERRIKAWAGQPMRTLRRMTRAEQAFLEARAEVFDGSASWIDIAARGGYSDQAHLCRETREITGLSPTELARASRDDETYWVYRIWS